MLIQLRLTCCHVCLVASNQFFAQGDCPTCDNPTGLRNCGITEYVAARQVLPDVADAAGATRETCVACIDPAPRCPSVWALAGGDRSEPPHGLRLAPFSRQLDNTTSPEHRFVPAPL
ncbi:hypothetical protein JKP88DRAFT_254256 [Tribonema minus]|uniref:4Fe-4S Wbl-type domain-containing protein n=1 Tax=Tribonema minus TaxID=303371 RepID=A0A836CKT9_9STRA|nr:hypothetical protein JKP88DRAFT_254256 [Tribonema minus]